MPTRPAQQGAYNSTHVTTHSRHKAGQIARTVIAGGRATSQHCTAAGGSSRLTSPTRTTASSFRSTAAAHQPCRNCSSPHAKMHCSHRSSAHSSKKSSNLRSAAWQCAEDQSTDVTKCTAGAARTQGRAAARSRLQVQLQNDQPTLPAAAQAGGNVTVTAAGLSMNQAADHAAAHRALPLTHKPAKQQCVGLQPSWQPDTSAALNMGYTLLTGSLTLSRPPTWMAAGQQLPNQPGQASAQHSTVDPRSYSQAAPANTAMCNMQPSACAPFAARHHHQHHACRGSSFRLKGAAGHRQRCLLHASSTAHSREASLPTAGHRSSCWAAVQSRKRRRHCSAALLLSVAKNHPQALPCAAHLTACCAALRPEAGAAAGHSDRRRGTAAARFRRCRAAPHRSS